ncbi:unnamed protein product [Polarella glacialis]|uniref:Ice-binding protein n=1 Tax=Polarella glacialis TaxID=89957 RepID=A0A813HSL6_POLGL|nr:unnamed protein product [Polarella glacialis]
MFVRIVAKLGFAIMTKFVFIAALGAIASVAATGPGVVDLGSACDYAILSKSGISTVPMSAITGNIGVSPIAATAITGFSPTADSTNTSATSTQVEGRVYAADYADPTPSQLTVAVGDMETAYTDAAGRANPDFVELDAGNLGGHKLIPGLYKFSSSVTFPTDCIISGSPTDTWIFQMSGDLTMATGTHITLEGGALASNIVWQVAGYVSVGVGAHMAGILLVKTKVDFLTGSSLNGRILSQTAVALQMTTVNSVAPVFPAGPGVVDLGSACDYAILSKSGISTVPMSAITGNIGVSPIAATAITGFSLTADSTNTFATSTQVEGRVYAADYADPMPSQLTVAVGDMETAYTDAAGRAKPDHVELFGGLLGGKTLGPGLYKFSTPVKIHTDLIISGSRTDTWIFQMSGDLVLAANKRVTLVGGALASNIVWQVAGYVEVGVGAHMEGNLLTKTAAHFLTGSSLNGRILAQTAVTLQMTTVNSVACVFPTGPGVVDLGSASDYDILSKSKNNISDKDRSPL